MWSEERDGDESVDVVGFPSPVLGEEDGRVAAAATQEAAEAVLMAFCKPALLES
jgi:hypothetical protein